MDDGFYLQNRIRNGMAIAVCGGSFKEGKGASAWVLEGEGGKSSNRMVGRNIVPGHAEDQSAYRSELAGILGVVSIVKELVKYYEIEEGHVTIGCNNISALDIAFDLDQEIHANILDYDMVTAIRAAISNNTITWSTEHISSHQEMRRKSGWPLHAWNG